MKTKRFARYFRNCARKRSQCREYFDYAWTVKYVAAKGKFKLVKLW